MAVQRKSGLGRGLDALLPHEHPERGFASIPVGDIDPNPAQPRRIFDDEAMEALTASVREVGLLQPVVVRSAGDRYTLVAGERRLRAARMAGLEEIPAVIRGESDGDDADLVEALVENVQREDLSPLEEAAAYRQLIEDFALTHDQVGERVGRSRSAVSNALRLLTLPAAVQALVDEGRLAAGAARALAGLDDEAYAVHTAKRAVAEGWSVRQVEEAARARRGEEPTPRTETAASATRPAAIIDLEERLSERLGAPVRIDMRGEAGKLTVRFGNLDDLEGIYRALLGS